MRKPRLLYVEDDVTLAFVTKDNLELRGFEVCSCEDGLKAKTVFENNTFDICILDIMLPKLDGFSLAKWIREQNPEIPIIFLSAKSTQEDKITGLKTGADDYITKPYSIEELILKIDVFLKRSKISSGYNIRNFKQGNLSFDYENLQINYPEKTIKLTRKEADLLLYFYQNKNSIVSREDILTNLWGDNDYFKGRSLDVFISRLRKYLKDEKSIKIENVHGVGFKYTIVEA